METPANATEEEGMAPTAPGLVSLPLATWMTQIGVEVAANTHGKLQLLATPPCG